MPHRNPATVRRRRLGARAAGWLIACLLPLSAPALGANLCMTGAPINFDPTRTGDSYATGPLAPPYVTLNKSAAIGSVVFDEPLPPVPWICTNPSAPHPKLYGGQNLLSVVSALKKVGLKLRIAIEGSGIWEPTGSTTAENAFELSETYGPKSPFDTTRVAYGILKGRLQLVTVTPLTQPTQAFFQAYLDLVDIHPGSTSTAVTNLVKIGSMNPTMVSLVPPCIVKLSAPAVIDLGRAYSVGSIPLPPKQTFEVLVDFNTTCDGGFDPAKLGSLIVPLKMMLQPEDGAPLTPQGDIELKNSESVPNGLALAMRFGGTNPIRFNTWHEIDSIATGAGGSPKRVTYSAELKKTGAPLVPGKFSQRVTVLVTFR